jgi:hypothetical protein
MVLVRALEVAAISAFIELVRAIGAFLVNSCWCGAELEVCANTVVYDWVAAFLEPRLRTEKLEIIAGPVPRFGLRMQCTERFWFEGARISVSRDDDSRGARGGTGGSICGPRQMYVLRAFRMRTLKNFVAHIKEDARLCVDLHVKISGERGWIPLPVQRPRRALSLPGTPVQDIITDARAFVDAEARYALLGVPFRRGYFLWGPPGTGKSSVAQVIASELGMPLCVLCARVREANDLWLLELFHELPERAVVLLDDLDRWDLGEGISLAGLLAALDGPVASLGKIVVITANDRARIDPALLRAGRVDVHREFTLMHSPAAEELFAVVYGAEAAQDFGKAYAIKVGEARPADVCKFMLERTGLQALDEVERLNLKHGTNSGL